MLTRKKLEALEYATQTMDGKTAIARVIENTLVLDCYINKTPVARYKINQNGYHEILVIARKKKGYLEPVEVPKWRSRSIADAFGDNAFYFSGSSIKIDEKSKGEIENFIGHSCGSYGCGVIKDKEWGYGHDRRERELQRKQKRINARMDQVPVLPGDIEDWAWETLFGGLHYMFQQKKGEYYCTACGKMHSDKTAKEYQKVICSRTGKTAIIRKRQQEVSRTDRMMVLQKMSETQTAARHFKVSAKWDGNGRTIQIYEEIRYLLGRGINKGSFEAYYGQNYDSDEFEQDWWDTNGINRRCRLEYLYPNGIEEALEGTRYHKIPYCYLAEQRMKLNYNNLMRYEESMPAFEYIAKSGLRKLARELSEYHWDNGINMNGTTMEEVLGIDRQSFQNLKRIDGGKAALEWIKWGKQNEKRIPDEAICWMEQQGVLPQNLHVELRRMSPLQIMNYYTRQSKESKHSVGQIKNLWGDYIRMAEAEGLDTWDEIVYRPRDLKLRHDQLVQVRNEKIAREREKDQKKKAAKIDRALRKIGGIYDYQDGEYTIIQPNHMRDIICEGTTLHHCVAASDQYFDKILAGESYILFLRKTEDPGKPYYTLEVEADGRILQKRSEYNRQPDLEKINSFLEKWKKEIQRRRKMEVAV